MNQTLIDATTKALEITEAKLAEAEDVAKNAQTAWVEAEAEAAELRDEVNTTRRALDVLQGRTPERDEPVQPEGDAVQDAEEESPEEFEKRIARERSQREKEQRDSGPYAGVACAACGTVGSLYDSVQTMKGRPIPVVACGNCSSIKMK